MDCFVLEAAGKHMGIEARYVYRIANEVRLAPVPLLPACHVGIIYYRGDLFDVIDMGRLLGEESYLINRNPYVILLKWDHRKLGLIPDRIVGLEWVEDTTDNLQTALTRDGRTIRIITPGEIWEILSCLSYGH